MAAMKKAPKKSGAKKQAPRKKAQGSIVFALDIGTRNVVGIVGEQADGVFKVIDSETCAHTSRAMKDGQIEDIEDVALLVKKVKNALEARLNVKLSHVSIAAAGRALKTQRVKTEADIPSSDPITSELQRSFEIEAVSKAQHELDKLLKSNGAASFYCVGHSVISFSLDGYPMKNLVGHKGKKAEIEIIAAFLPSPVVESLYAVTEKNKLKVSSLTLEPIAAMNVIIPPEIRLINIALVDIGAGTSDIAVSQSGSIVAYAMATIAGDEITEEIIKAYLVDFEMAERMKLSSKSDEIAYTDILGIEHSVSSEDFFKSVYPAVDSLADTIAQHIIDINKQAPSAVFLVGGGSLIKGLPAILAKKLDIAESRVAVGGHNFIKNVVLADTKISGPEYVTPVGIGVTATLQGGYDFSTVVLNDRKFKVLDTKNMTVLDLLMLGGFKTRQIIGHNGKNLSFSLNAKTVTHKGTPSTPAQLFLNDSPCSLDTHITQGDSVRIIPAMSGVSAKLLISDVCGEVFSGKITLDEKEYFFGNTAVVNGSAVDSDYEIKNGDIAQVSSVLTLYELLESIEFDRYGYKFQKGKGIISGDTALSDGDVFVSIKQEDIKTQKSQQHTPDLNIPPMKKGTSKITITLNSTEVTLPEKDDDSPHLFLEVLPLLDLDLSNPTGSIVMRINGKEAQYMSRLNETDDVEVYFE